MVKGQGANNFDNHTYKKVMTLSPPGDFVCCMVDGKKGPLSPPHNHLSLSSFYHFRDHLLYQQILAVVGIVLGRRRTRWSSPPLAICLLCLFLSLPIISLCHYISPCLSTNLDKTLQNGHKIPYNMKDQMLINMRFDLNGQ